MGMPRNSSGEIFKQLTEALERIEYLEKVKIPDIISTKDAEKWKLERTLKEENRKLRASITEKDEELRLLREELGKEQNEVARLKSILNNNSKNSSISPSQDQPGQSPTRPKSQNEYNDRDKKKKDGAPQRKKGGQKGHAGKTLTKEDVEKIFKKYDGKCEHEIYNVGNNKNGKYRVKYVLGMKVVPVIKEYRYYDDAEIPPEHYSDVTYDSSITAIAGYCYGECNMPTDKIGQLLTVITGGVVNLSEGTCYNLCRRLAEMSDCKI